MPVRFRKSVSVGGVRLNFGKRGLTSVSSGTRGFRVTTGRSGTNITVGIPGTGVSYTQRVGGTTPGSVSVVDIAQPVQTADVSNLVELSSQELLNRINKQAKQFPIAVIAIIASVLLLYPAYLIWDILTIPVLIIGVIVAWWIHRLDVQARTTHLHYEMDEKITQDHAVIRAALDSLMQSEVVWRVTSHQGADWKQHGGARTLITREHVTINKVKPPYITANVSIPVISDGSIDLFFLPDHLFIWQQKQYGAVSYSSLSVEAGSTRFVEDGLVPKDSNIVGQTWQHPNKSGGPDRRFASNRQLDIAMYGAIALISPTGLNLSFQVSNERLARQFAEILQETPCKVFIVPGILM
jgi:hypothetical protein